jgi:hypothetical protein
MSDTIIDRETVSVCHPLLPGTLGVIQSCSLSDLNETVIFDIADSEQFSRKRRTIDCVGLKT